MRKVLAKTKEFAEQLGVPNPEEYIGVHANYYPDGDSSVTLGPDAHARHSLWLTAALTGQ